MKPNYTFCMSFKLLVAFGVTVTSSLALSAFADCVAPPANLVSWWRAEGNATDAIGSNNGVPMNGTGFASGKVGQAFTFNGVNQFVRIPDAPSLNPVDALTLEAWVYVSAYPTIDIVTIVGKEDPAGVHQYQLTLWNTQGRWCFRPTIVVAGNYAYLAGNTSVQTGQWYHIATTYDGNTLNLYVNGKLDGTVAASGTVATSPQPLRIGGDETGWFFTGLVDEVSLYNRGLSAAEIQAIYNADSAGKCTGPSLPVIYSQPTNETVTAGQTASFTVAASGTFPLSYQWTFNDAILPGQTTALLVLPAVQLSQAGNYAVVITNSLGSVTSSVAVLTVNTAPPCAGAAVPTGLIGWWQAEGNANDETGANNGTLMNGTAFTAGEVGQAFSFNGVNQFVKIPDSPALDPTNALSLEAWVYVTAYPSLDIVTIIGKEDPAGVHQYQLTLWNTQGRWCFRPTITVNGFGAYMAGNTAVQLGQWYHIATTYDGNTVNLYVNGNLDGSVPASGTVATSTQPLRIGGDETGWFFNGLVDEVSLYGRALFANEIQGIYGAGHAGKCATPVAPTIYAQPTNQIVFATQAVNFTVGANGTLPLSYQWNFNGVAIPGATDLSLVLTNLQLDQAGLYTVVVSNSIASVLSSNAVLTVNPPPACYPAPAGLISWWPGERDAGDVTAGNSGTLSNAVSFAPGLVGEAFTFTAANQIAVMPNSSSLNPTNALSIEGWMRVTAFPPVDASVIAAKEDVYGIRQYELDVLHTGNQLVFMSTIGVPGGFIAYIGTNSIQLNSWAHVAMTYDGSLLSLYVNGKLDGTRPVTGPIVTGGAPFTIGGLGTGPWSFFGQVDELSLYNRALSAADIQGIYSAAVSGKCSLSVPPVISLEPAGQTLTIGQTASFSVVAGGMRPLSYQWTFNGTSIAGATTPSLVITNVQLNQSGMYAVVITNNAGSVTSSNAVLTVNFPPANVIAENSSADALGNVTVPIVLAANGNENALGFSLNFNPALLSYVSTSLGSGGTGATLFVNSTQVASGQLGVIVSLPTGMSLSAGTQEVVDVTFAASVLTNATVAQLTFGDQPTRRQLSDPQANSLAANFIGGTVSIPAAEFEGDVSPRPTGDKAVTITDWVLVGRYAARLDYPTNASEYQRADCAPRSTLGDGAITVADWVQTGRYAVGLDRATRAGGPTNDVGPLVVNLNSRPKPTPKGLTRRVSVANVNLVQGQSGTVSVYLDAQGDENALSFSVAFDPTVLGYVSASVGADAPGATLDINTNQGSAGKAAFLLAMPIGSSFTAGTKEILKLNLGTVPSAAGLYPVALTDQPVVRQVVDATATPLTATYQNGSITVNPPPSLTATRSQQNINLSWPLWATNFVLQEADGALMPSLTWSNVPGAFSVTNNAAVVTLPISGTTKFYRLQK